MLLVSPSLNPFLQAVSCFQPYPLVALQLGTVGFWLIGMEMISQHATAHLKTFSSSSLVGSPSFSCSGSPEHHVLCWLATDCFLGGVSFPQAAVWMHNWCSCIHLSSASPLIGHSLFWGENGHTNHQDQKVLGRKWEQIRSVRNLSEIGVPVVILHG